MGNDGTAFTGRRVVVIGADAAGMSAAAQIRRMSPQESVTRVRAFDKGKWTSYSACGIPYLVAGDVHDVDDLVARTPEEHRARGIEVRLEHEVLSIDAARSVLRIRNRDGEFDEPFDDLIIATGATPIVPDVAGLGAIGVTTVQHLDDALFLLAEIGQKPASAVVLGAGYIGLEMAESLSRRGLAVSVVDRADEPMVTIDPELGVLVRKALADAGISFHGGSGLESIEVDSRGRVSAVVTGTGRYEADLVVVGFGVKPAASLASAAGLPVGEHGGILTDERQQVLGHPHIWAAGDCVETRHRVTGASVNVALGTHANKQGRVLGTNLMGGRAEFPGVVGTAVTRVCALEIGRTGLSETQAHAAGLDVVVATAESSTRAGYFPGAEPLTVKVVAERGSGRLLGVTVLGGPGAAKRIDAAAVAVWNAMPVAEVAMVDLGYAPPFSPVSEAFLIAAGRAAELT